MPQQLQANSGYPTYMPALNRAGWYKYLFIEFLGEPESLEKVLTLFCSETYKPSSPLHPDLARRDKTQDSVLGPRANELRTAAVARVCQEIAAVMKPAQGGGGGAVSPDAAGGMSAQEAALKMQSLQIQQQMNQMMNQATVQGGQSFSMAAGNTYVPRY